MIQLTRNQVKLLLMILALLAAVFGGVQIKQELLDAAEDAVCEGVGCDEAPTTTTGATR